MQDQCALSLFTMPTGEGLTEQAQRYIELWCTEEIERLERRIESERRAAELVMVEHERLLKERSYEAPRSRRGRAPAAPTSPAVTTAPPRAPEPAIANSAASMFHFLNCLFSCSGGHAMAFGTCCLFIFASHVMAFGTCCHFFLLRRSSDGLRHLLLFCFGSGGPVMAFGSSFYFIFAPEVL